MQDSTLYNSDPQLGFSKHVLTGRAVIQSFVKRASNGEESKWPGYFDAGNITNGHPDFLLVRTNIPPRPEDKVIKEGFVLYCKNRFRNFQSQGRLSMTKSLGHHRCQFFAYCVMGPGDSSD